MYFIAKKQNSGSRKNSLQNEPVDVLFFSSTQAVKKKNGKKINIWTSPIFDILAANFRLKQETIEMYENIDGGEVSQALVKNRNKYYLQKSYKHLLSAFGLKTDSVLEMEGLKDFIGYLENSEFGVTFSAGSLEQRLELLVNNVKFFNKFFSAKKPKVIFTHAFYSDDFLAVVYAARSMGIPVVEIQHGLIRPYSFAYTHWNSRDSASMFFVPDYCLTHDEGTAELINETSGNYMKAFYTGNFNLLEELRERKENPSENILKNENKELRHILVTTTNGELLSEKIITAINKDSQYIWHVKLHPRYSSDALYAQYKSILPGQNVRIYYKENLSVYDFFELCSVHITEFSYVAIEAQVVGLTNIIIGEIGRDIFSDEIEKGIFYSCATEEDIAKVLADYRIFDNDKKNSFQADQAEQRLLKFFKKEILIN
ncbi:MAG: hypothetical protein NT150_04570 [Bacteroidetes bacterium]|nr:hypothetical protein [Bacteroidota bacterium]